MAEIFRNSYAATRLQLVIEQLLRGQNLYDFENRLDVIAVDLSPYLTADCAKNLKPWQVMM